MFKISSLTLTLQRCGNFYKPQMNTYYGISYLYFTSYNRLHTFEEWIIIYPYTPYHKFAHKKGRKRGSISGEFGV